MLFLLSRGPQAAHYSFYHFSGRCHFHEDRNDQKQYLFVHFQRLMISMNNGLCFILPCLINGVLDNTPFFFFISLTYILSNLFGPEFWEDAIRFSSVGDFGDCRGWVRMGGRHVSMWMEDWIECDFVRISHLGVGMTRDGIEIRMMVL